MSPCSLHPLVLPAHPPICPLVTDSTEMTELPFLERERSLLPPSPRCFQWASPFSWEHAATRLQCLVQDCEQLKSQLPHCTATLQQTHRTQDILKLTPAQQRGTNDRLKGPTALDGSPLQQQMALRPFPDITSSQSWVSSAYFRYENQHGQKMKVGASLIL